MKNYLTATALALVATGAMSPTAASAAVFTGFTGPFAPNTFATTLSGNVNGASVVLSPTTLTIVGGDDPTVDPNSGMSACIGGTTGFLGPCQVTVTHGLFGGADNVSFHWSYSTTDISPETDLFGVIVDGVRTLLSDPGGPLTQSGNFNFLASSNFGFFVNCTDCVGGAATAAVTGFQVAVVPEPATIALLGVAGAGALAAGRRRRTWLVAARPA